MRVYEPKIKRERSLVLKELLALSDAKKSILSAIFVNAVGLSF